MKTVVFLLIGNIRYDGRVLKEISTLRRAGHKVALILSDFDADDDVANYDFDIVLLRRKYGENLLMKVLTTISFFFRIRKAIISLSPDILHCNDLNTLMFAFALSKKMEIVYDAHELYLESRSGIVRTFWGFVEKKLIKKAKAVIVPQIDRLYYMYFRYNLPLERFFLIENFPNRVEGLSSSFYKDKYNIDRENKQIITYIGGITPEREIATVIRAVQPIDNILFFIIGKGTEAYKKKLENLIRELQIQEKVFLCPPIPHQEVLHAVNSSDIGVCFYNEHHLNSYFCASNKLYEYLNLGVKVLTNNTAGVARVIKPGENGFCCNVITVDEVRKGVMALLKMGKFSPTNYYWENQESRLLSIYR